MTRLRTTNGLLLIVLLAVLGVLLVYVPTKVVELYDRVKGLGPPYIYFYWGMVGTGAAILVAPHRRNRRQACGRPRATNVPAASEPRKDPSQLSAADKEREVADNLAAVEELRGKSELARRCSAATAIARRPRRRKAGRPKTRNRRLRHHLQRQVVAARTPWPAATPFKPIRAAAPRAQRLEIPWPGDDHVLLVDTPGLGEVEGAEHVAIAAQAARDADLVLLVVDGPLRDSEHQPARRSLGEMEKRILVCLNKADWYDDERKVVAPRPNLRASARHRSARRRARRPLAADAAARASACWRGRRRARRASSRRRRYQPAAPAECWKSSAPAAATCCWPICCSARAAWSKTPSDWSRKPSIKKPAKSSIATPGPAAAAAALSPLPLARSVRVQRLHREDGRRPGPRLSARARLRHRRQPARPARQEPDRHSRRQRRRPRRRCGARLAAQRQCPIAGTIAGGALQGIVQALVTRWIGLVFIDYFKSEMKLPPEGLANLARREWQQLTSPAELVKFLQEAKARFRGQSDD